MPHCSALQCTTVPAGLVRRDGAVRAGNSAVYVVCCVRCAMAARCAVAVAIAVEPAVVAAIAAAPGYGGQPAGLWPRRPLRLRAPGGPMQHSCTGRCCGGSGGGPGWSGGRGCGGGAGAGWRVWGRRARIPRYRGLKFKEPSERGGDLFCKPPPPSLPRRAPLPAPSLVMSLKWSASLY